MFLCFLSFIIFKTKAQVSLSQLLRGGHGISKQLISIPENQYINFSVTSLNELLNINAASQLVLTQTVQDKSNFIHYRYYQTYKGVRVENSLYIVHTKNGLLKSLGGNIVTDFDPIIDKYSSAKISVEHSINAAVKYADAKIYAWQDDDMQQRIKKQTGNSNASYKPAASLVWYSADEDAEKLRLCYKVDVYAIKPLSRAYYYVDAITAKVLGREDEIFYSDTTGTAATAYSRIQTIHSDYNNGSCRLRDYSKGGGILTFHGEPDISGTDYISTPSNWNLAGTNQAALDIHYGLSQTYLFYKTVFNRNSYDDRGATITAYVNTLNTDASFWDGNAVIFGNRSSGANGGMAAIDIVGHELTHGITQQTSGLIYSKESGAMNESMSDIFGKSVQFWTKPNDLDWRLGNDMNFILRDMSNPKAYNQPNTYKGINWAMDSYDNYGVHTNCGVGNFMFYLLVEGGSGTNDNGNNYSVTGIGITKAEAILYRTNAMYLTPTSQYADWRTACINAAADLYGASSKEVTQVENAWYAVGIGAPGIASCATPVNLVSSSVTSSSAALSWSAIPGAATYNLQYKISSASAWITITGILTSSYTITGLNAGTAYNYQVQTVCSGNSSGSYSPALSFTTSGIAYCYVKGNTTYEYINKVTLGSINNTSGNNNGYGDYTSLTATLNAGTSKAITLTPGFTNAAYKEYWTVYIDYDKNKVFDANEEVTSSNGTGTVSRTFTIPANAKSGYTRMRVIMHYNSSRTNTCDTFSGGEVEDYRIHIINTSTGNSANVDAESTLSSGMFVTPDPAEGNNVKVMLHLPQVAPVTLRITDISGRLLANKKLSNVSRGQNIYRMNGLHLKPGTYVIIAEQGNGIVARTKFIVVE